MSAPAKAFFDWLNRLKEQDGFAAYTNDLPNGDTDLHGGDKPKGTIVFESLPDDVVAAINDSHVRVLDGKTITDEAPAWNGAPRASITLTPTDRFSRPEQ